MIETHISEAASHQGLTPFLDAVCRGDAEAVGEFLSRGEEDRLSLLNQTATDGCTAVHLAALHAQRNILEMLISTFGLAAIQHLTNIMNLTAFHIAVHQDPSMCELFFETPGQIDANPETSLKSIRDLFCLDIEEERFASVVNRFVLPKFDQVFGLKVFKVAVTTGRDQVAGKLFEMYGNYVPKSSIPRLFVLAVTTNTKTVAMRILEKKMLDMSSNMCDEAVLCAVLGSWCEMLQVLIDHGFPVSTEMIERACFQRVCSSVIGMLLKVGLPVERLRHLPPKCDFMSILSVLEAGYFVSEEQEFLKRNGFNISLMALAAGAVRYFLVKAQRGNVCTEAPCLGLPVSLAELIVRPWEPETTIALLRSVQSLKNVQNFQRWLK